MEWTSVPPTVPGFYLYWTMPGHMFCWNLVPRFDGQLVAKGVHDDEPRILTPVSKWRGVFSGPIDEPVETLPSNTATQTMHRILSQSH